MNVQRIKLDIYVSLERYLIRSLVTCLQSIIFGESSGIQSSTYEQFYNTVSGRNSLSQCHI